MNLPIDFIFSQSSLQDFSECRRRFFLRYIQKLSWPAPPAEPFIEVELAVQKGARFHHIVHQHLSGCPAERIDALLSDDPELNGWWQNYLAFYGGLEIDSGEEQAQVFTEHTLFTTLKDRRFLAKYDLLLVFPSQKCWIVDWKTGGQKPGAKRHLDLAGRWQTNLYPWILHRTGGSSHLPVLEAEDIEMVYWFAGDPTGVERFSFTQALAEEIETSLAYIVDLIFDLNETDFEKTADDRKCLFCPYRSLCDRGIAAGILRSAERDLLDDSGLDLVFDFNEISELPYQSF